MIWPQKMMIRPSTHGQMCGFSGNPILSRTQINTKARLVWFHILSMHDIPNIAIEVPIQTSRPKMVTTVPSMILRGWLWLEIGYPKV